MKPKPQSRNRFSGINISPRRIPVKQFNRVNAEALRLEVEAAVQEIADRNGYEIKPTRGSFSSASMTIHTEFVIAAAYEEQSKELAALYGLDKSVIGREFKHHGRTFKVLGINPRARRMPVTCIRDDGKRWKYSALAIKTLLNGGTK